MKSPAHAIGDRAIKSIFPAAKLEGRGQGQVGYYKFDRIAEALEIPKYLQAFVRKTVQMAMLHGAGIAGLMAAKDIDAWQHLVSHYGIDTEIADDNAVMQLRGREQLILEGLRFAHQALNLGKKIAHEVYSYDDMLWLPLILNARLPQYDWLCIDEAQDTNPVRHEMVKRMMHAKSRAMFVGDNFQSIYGFAGASSDSLDLIERDFSCKVFPMTVTFRCSKAVVALAQRLVPDYKAAEGNAEGEVLSISEAEFNKIDLVPGQDAIICRNTRPLITVAYNLIKRGIAAHIEGREIGKGLLALTTRWSTIKTIPALMSKLSEWRDREVAKMTAAKQEMQAEALADRVEAVFAIIEGLPKGASLTDLRSKIDSMFSDTDAGKKAGAKISAGRGDGEQIWRVRQDSSENPDGDHRRIDLGRQYDHWSGGWRHGGQYPARQ